MTENKYTHKLLQMPVLAYQLYAGQACPIPRQSGIVDPGVKVNGQYYQDILLTRDLLPDITQYSDYFTLQQDGAPAHRARETVELLKVETPDFIPVDYKIWGILQERVYKKSSKDVDELRRRIAEEWDKLDQRYW